MGITIVTHHRPSFGRDISKCVDSVNEAIDGLIGIKHEIISQEIDTQEGFQRMRHEAHQLDDYVILVDDDDYISANSIKLCQIAVAENPDVGVFYTKESKVLIDGRILPSSPDRLYYNNALTTPQSIHHMAVVKSKYVTEKSLNASLAANHGVEWLIKVEALTKGGALHVPIMAYYWCQHADQHHRKKENISSDFVAKRKYLLEEIQKWPMPYKGLIPVWA